MMKTLGLMLALIVLSAAVVKAGEQSLAEVAKAEESRRKAMGGKSRVYTNGDLKPTGDTPGSPATVPTAVPKASENAANGDKPQASATNETQVTDEKPELVKPREKRDEKHWQERAQAIRSRLSQLRADVTAIQSRIEILSAAPQTPAIASETRQSQQDLNRFQSELRLIEVDWAQFEDRAREAKVPSAWLQ